MGTMSNAEQLRNDLDIVQGLGLLPPSAFSETGVNGDTWY